VARVHLPFLHNAQTLPHHPDPQSGKVFGENNHGFVFYETLSEKRSREAWGYCAGGCALLAFLTAD
jgi:hypothetical protein